MSEKKSKKQSKRSATKYPALKRNLNLKRRRYYIEPDYIDGVRDHEGNEVIRPLNEEEKAWLNKFYSETIITSFEEEDPFYTGDKRRELYRENNRRNRCVYNLKLATGKLDTFNVEQYEKLQEESFDSIDHELILIEQIEKKAKEDELFKIRKPRKKPVKTS